MLQVNPHEDTLKFRRFDFRELDLSPLRAWFTKPFHLGKFRSRLKMEHPGAKCLMGGVLKTMLFARGEKEKRVRIGGHLSLAVPHRGIPIRDKRELKERVRVQFALRIRAVPERAEG